jgi:hypothetical protein
MDYTLILNTKYPNSEWTLNGDDYDGLIWLSESKKPTKSELDAHWPELATYWDDKKAEQESTKAALLERLGITADEAALLLG